jgi:hypothetical protein
MRAAEMNMAWGREERFLIDPKSTRSGSGFCCRMMKRQKALEQKHLSTCSASRILFLPLIDLGEGIFDGNLWVLWI